MEIGEFDGINVTDGSDLEVAEAVGKPVEQLTVADVWRRMTPEKKVLFEYVIGALHKRHYLSDNERLVFRKLIDRCSHIELKIMYYMITVLFKPAEHGYLDGYTEEFEKWEEEHEKR